MDQIAKRFKDVKRITIPDSDESAEDGDISEIVAKLIATKKKGLRKGRKKLLLSARENGLDTTEMFENLITMSKERGGVVEDVGVKVDELAEDISVLVQEQKRKEERLKVLSDHFDKALERPRSSMKTMNGCVEELKQNVKECEQETLTFRKKSEDELKKQLSDKKRKITDRYGLK